MGSAENTAGRGQGGENCTLRGCHHQSLEGHGRPCSKCPSPSVPRCPGCELWREPPRHSRVPINPRMVTLTYLHMQRPLFPIKSHSEVLVGCEPGATATQPTPPAASRRGREEWAPKTQPSSPGSVCPQPPPADPHHLDTASGKPPCTPLPTAAAKSSIHPTLHESERRSEAYRGTGRTECRGGAPGSAGSPLTTPRLPSALWRHSGACSAWATASCAPPPATLPELHGRDGRHRVEPHGDVPVVPRWESPASLIKQSYS